MANWRETLRGNFDKLARRLEPDPIKRHYYAYLEEKLVNLYSADFNQPRLIAKLANPRYQPTPADLDQAIVIARYLCDFGRRCDLFDDYTYAVAITQADTDINDLAAVAKLFTKVNEEACQKALRLELSASEVRRAAAVSYHLTSLKWLAAGICPVLHSPYRPR